MNQKKKIKELPVNICVNARNKNKDAYPKHYDRYFHLKLRELYPFWCDSADELDIDFVCLRKKHKADVLKTMQILIESSPIRRIVFLAKYQIVDDSEFIYGTINYEKFVELL